MYAYRFDHGRFDVGNKLDYLKATVEMAIERDDVGPAFRAVPRRGRGSATTPTAVLTAAPRSRRRPSSPHL